MSKPGSPFLKKWMQHYKDVKAKKNRDDLAKKTPYLMHNDRDPDLTVLDGYSWFYSLSAEMEGDAPLKTLWFGKSWHDVNRSYGTHFWHPTETFGAAIKPSTIQTIDTPLFCHTRKLFDNLDNDSYYAEPPETNPNCSITWTKDLKKEDHRIFSDYQITTDTIDTKLLDSSGFHNHGWAPNGLLLHQSSSPPGPVRGLSPKSYAVLPVPADWDARLWTARLTFELDNSTLASGNGIGLFKIRIETGGEILVRVRNDNPYPGITVKVEWHGNRLAKEEYQSIDDQRWIFDVGLPSLATGPHELSLTHDRSKNGTIALYLDALPLATAPLSLIASPKIGQDIWLNAQEWDELDTGFRGILHRFTMYADALTPQAIAAPITSSAQNPSTMAQLKSSIASLHATSSLWALLFPCIMLMLVFTFHLRKKKGFLTAAPEYASRIPELTRNIPSLALDLMKRTRWPRSPSGKG